MHSLSSEDSDRQVPQWGLAWFIGVAVCALFVAAEGLYVGVPFLYLAAAVPLCAGSCCFRLQLAAAVVTALVFKNVILLLVMHAHDGVVPQRHLLQTFLASDTVFLALLAIVGFVARRGRMPLEVAVMSAIVAAYLFVGVSKGASSAAAAMSYARMLLLPAFGVMAASALIPVRGRFVQLLYLMLGLLLTYLAVELVVPGFNEVLDVGLFSRVKYGDDYMLTRDFVSALGTTVGGVELGRLLGPQIHPISVGYLCVATMVLFDQSRTIGVARLLMAIPLGAIAAFTSKGAAFLLFVYVAATATGLDRGRLGLLGTSIAYGIVLIVGSAFPWSSAFEHFKGLLGGLGTGFGAPLGIGLGMAGNLSVSRSLATGAESMFGLVIASMGVFGLLYYVLLWSWVLRAGNSWNPAASRSALAVSLILVNSFLQEEAFSASALLLPIMLLAFATRSEESEVRRGSSIVSQPT